MLSLLVVDETDNSDYFIYKFNISKKDQKRILIIKNFFYKKGENQRINTKNLWKVFYKYGKESLKDILNYKLFNSKKIDKKIIEHLKFFDDKNVPIFPIKGEELMKKFDIPQGKKLGENLEELEQLEDLVIGLRKILLLYLKLLGWIKQRHGKGWEFLFS